MTVRIVFRPENLGFDGFRQVDTGCFPDEPIGADKFAEMVAQDFWAVFGDDEFIGYGYVTLKPGFAWIVRVGVAPGWRNRGVGNSLMETMIDHCRKQGRSRIILYVQQDNPPAIRLYRRFGFSESESTCQYVIPIQGFLDSHRQSASNLVRSVPVTEVDASLLPSFPDDWADIESLHHPPDNHVLIFMTEGGQTAGFCRLSPEFPGCFPFVVENPAVERLIDIVISLEEYLNPEKRVLKLTFSDEALVEACERLGFELNYNLFKMERESG